MLLLGRMWSERRRRLVILRLRVKQRSARRRGPRVEQLYRNLSAQRFNRKYQSRRNSCVVSYAIRIYGIFPSQARVFEVHTPKRQHLESHLGSVFLRWLNGLEKSTNTASDCKSNLLHFTSHNALPEGMQIFLPFPLDENLSNRVEVTCNELVSS
jgi:hypothetical protein